MTYFRYCSELKIRNRGEVEHHVIPKSVMGENNFLTVKCSPQEHLFAHLLFDRENETRTRTGLWNQFSRALELDWRTCSYEDLEGFNEDWAHMGRKVSEAKKGKPSPMKGKTPSEGTREKISEALKGHLVSSESRKRMSEAKKGKKRAPFSDEWKQRMSEANKGIAKSEETKQKLKATQQLQSQEYHEYKANGGGLKWNEWCKQRSSNH